MRLAIDQGTTGTTCLVVDDELNSVGRAYRWSSYAGSAGTETSRAKRWPS